MILAGDIGGTKVNLALFDIQEGIPRLSVERSYPSRNFPDLDSLLQSFLQETQPRLTHACLGVAGPVHQGRCQLTHLPWNLNVRELQSLLRIEAVSLINDLAALAHAIPRLSPDEMAVIQQGQEDPEGNKAVLAAGTGLGQAFILPEGKDGYRILETEGGQCDFSPRTDLEISLLKYLNRIFDRVAIEDVVSGPGLIRLYEFVKEQNQDIEPLWLADEFDREDPALVISRNGLSKKYAACQQALELFVSALGAVAGNLALQILARGGVYLGGGIAPEILPLLQSATFLDGFCGKGKFRDWMTEVPVKVVMNKRAPLLGAAHFALGENPIQ